MRPTRTAESLLLSPLAILLLSAIVIPIGILFAYSFFTFTLLQAHPAFILDNYKEVFTESTYRTFAVNTALIAGPTTVLSVLGGYAVSYFIVFSAKRTRNVLLALVVVSLMASYLVRIYAWRTLLGENGIINSLLQSIGLTHGPLEFLIFSRLAAVVAEVQLYLPFAALVFYASLSGISADLREAARDLGAGGFERLRRVMLPLSGPAILAATAFTFFVSAADYITPVFVGGPHATTFGTVIADSLRVTGDYPLGAALSFVTVALFALVYLVVHLVMKAMHLLPEVTQRA